MRTDAEIEAGARALYDMEMSLQANDYTPFAELMSTERSFYVLAAQRCCEAADAVVAPDVDATPESRIAFFLSEDAYLASGVEDAADAVAAPAVGVTVAWLDARIAESEEKQRGQFWAAQLPEAGKVLAYREVRALLTAAPADDAGEE